MLRTELANAFRQGAPIHREQLRRVRDRVLRQPGRLGGEQRIAGRVGPGQVAGQRHTHDRPQTTAIQGVPLHHHHGPTDACGRAPRHWQFGPPELPLLDLYHSTRASTDCAAARTNASGVASS